MNTVYLITSDGSGIKVELSDNDLDALNRAIERGSRIVEVQEA
jgi:hypothetical protein